MIAVGALFALEVVLIVRSVRARDTAEVGGREARSVELLWTALPAALLAALLLYSLLGDR